MFDFVISLIGDELLIKFVRLFDKTLALSSQIDLLTKLDVTCGDCNKSIIGLTSYSFILLIPATL
jgi:hypothetical protein